MVINQLETNLQAITTTIAYLEKENCTDKNLLKNLRAERNKLLKDLNLINNK